MNVYLVSINRTDYRRLEFLTDYDAMSRIPIEEGGHPEDWSPPVSQYVDMEKPLADFTVLDDDFIVYDFDSIDSGIESPLRVGDLAEMAGGVAFVDVEDGPRHSILFVTEACNALNHRKTIWQVGEKGVRAGIEQFEFHASRIFSNSGLFRLAEPGLDRQYIFAYDDGSVVNGEHFSFLERYRRRGMRGLDFTLVWSDAEAH